VIGINFEPTLPQVFLPLNDFTSIIIKLGISIPNFIGVLSYFGKKTISIT